MTRDERWLLEEKYDCKAIGEFERDKDRLAKGEPIGYVIGYQPFLGLKIFLDSKPLIPRPETEWWAETLFENAAGHELAGRNMGSLRAAWPSLTPMFLPASERPFQFLDLCAGSGAVGCAALARLPNAHVYFGEIDHAHETTIRKNILENNLDESRASVRIGDLFTAFSNMQFDIIAANPPYVPTDRVLPESVTGHEPERALRAGEDGLAVIRRIALELGGHLARNGVAWIECDSARAQAARELFLAQGFKANVLADQYGRPRVLIVSLR